MVGNQVDPGNGRTLGTGLLLEALLQLIGEALSLNGDTDFVHAGLERLARHGNGAQRQRNSFQRGGLVQVVGDAGEELTA